MTLHIYPLNDLKEHLTDGEDCPCNPISHVLETGDIQVVHNSWDGREYIERLTDPENIVQN